MEKWVNRPHIPINTKGFQHLGLRETLFKSNHTKRHFYHFKKSF